MRPGVRGTPFPCLKFLLLLQGPESQSLPLLSVRGKAIHCRLYPGPPRTRLQFNGPYFFLPPLNPVLSCVPISLNLSISLSCYALPLPGSPPESSVKWLLLPFITSQGPHSLPATHVSVCPKSENYQQMGPLTLFSVLPSQAGYAIPNTQVMPTK